MEVEVGGVESVLSATVVEIERNQGRIANPGPKVIVLLIDFIVIFVVSVVVAIFGVTCCHRPGRP